MFNKQGFKLIIVLVLLLIAAEIKGKAYYVSGMGKDGNDGLSTNTAFLTIQKAADLVKPGDIVLVMNGLYKNTHEGFCVLIKTSGTSNAWITFKAYPGHKPKIEHNSWNGIIIQGADYIIIEGFTIEGNSDNITLEYAQAEKDNLGNPLTCGNGIAITRNEENKDNVDYCHHILIRNNIVYKCSGGGIYTMYADYVTIEGNIVYSNSFWSPYNNSGISILGGYDVDDYAGYKNFVTRNVSYGNYNYIPCQWTGKVTDGNGIIIDTIISSEEPYKSRPYKGRTLVANNITFNNGGSGIHSFRGAHVDIFNNTAYMNGRHPDINDGQIHANACDDVKILNNILYAPENKKVNSNWNNKDTVIYDYNIYFGGNEIVRQGPHDIIGKDPEFINPSINPLKIDFHIKKNSPAIDSGTDVGLKEDFKGNKRPAGKAYDMGAYEFIP